MKVMLKRISHYNKWYSTEKGKVFDVRNHNRIFFLLNEKPLRFLRKKDCEILLNKHD